MSALVASSIPDGPGPSDYMRRASLDRSTAALSLENRHSHSPAGVGLGINEPEGMQVDREEEDGRFGVLPPDAPRAYTAIKLVGDGSFGTVWLCDWSSPVPAATTLSAMQCGAGARAEWAGKRLVAVKRMKRVWEGGWKEASRLGELVSLKEISSHPAIIPLYDAFLQPSTKELYFVFECMEGNLYQLTKSRKGRPLAQGLVASVFHQIVGGLDHIHKSGYFHRDMKPENLLVTTTGLQDYMPVVEEGDEDAPGEGSPQRPPKKIEKDVTVIVKLADFGLARALSSAPPYTEYVSTRWYRAPEVLLRSKDYFAPVDMWALGTILAELVNLKALFPGQSEVDQVWRICETLGDPSREYGKDERGLIRGGGEWDRGIKMAKAVGFAFPKKIPVQFHSLFAPTVPRSLVDCIAELLRYNPKRRLTSAECIDHPYFHLTAPHLKTATRLPQIPFSQGQPSVTQLTGMLQQMEQQRLQQQQQQYGMVSPASIQPRTLPPSHSASPVGNKPGFGADGGRTLPPLGQTSSDSLNTSRLFFPTPSAYSPGAQDTHSHRSGSSPANAGASALVDQLRELDLPTADLSSYGHRPLPEQKQQGGSGGYYQGNAEAPVLGRVMMGASATALRQFDQSYAHQRSHLPPHMMSPTALASGNQSHGSPYGQEAQEQHHHQQQQQQQHQHSQSQSLQRVDEDTNMDAPSRAPQPTPHYQPEPVRQAESNAAALAQAPKKKKWGLSSVFGGGSDSKVHQQTPPPAAASSSGLSSNSLKRTQSGQIAAERKQAPAPPPQQQIDPATITDPKKAKKEAERQAKELERAKRDAMERAQKERARAVMQKRNQLQESRFASGSKGDLEWDVSVNPLNPVPAPVAQAGKSSLGQHVNRSQDTIQRSGEHPSSQYGGSSANSRSQASVRTPVVQSHSRLSQQSLQALQAQGSPLLDGTQAGAYRAKARRRDDDDDHSMSSADYSRFQSPSMVTVGTVDSDPGPARSPRQYPYDPNAQRTASSSSFNLRQAQMRSNASLDRQLARDFATHASVASPSSQPYGSSSSLGRYATSSTSLSGPTTPYGQSGHAPFNRSGQVLPSIADWENSHSEMPVDPTGVNPMFRVPYNGDSNLPTLPPFSAIASVADAQPKIRREGGR